MKFNKNLTQSLLLVGSLLPIGVWACKPTPQASSNPTSVYSKNNQFYYFGKTFGSDMDLGNHKPLCVYSVDLTIRGANPTQVCNHPLSIESANSFLDNIAVAFSFDYFSFLISLDRSTFSNINNFSLMTIAITPYQVRNNLPRNICLTTPPEFKSRSCPPVLRQDLIKLLNNSAASGFSTDRPRASEILRRLGESVP